MARKRISPLQNPNVQGILVLSVVFVIAVLFIWNNRQPAPEYVLEVPPTATRLSDSLQLPSPLPTFTASPLPAEDVPPSPTFAPPTIPPTAATVESFSPNEIAGGSIEEILLPTEIIIVTSPTPSPIFLAATPIPAPTQFNVDPASIPQDNPQFQLPPEQVPLSRGPNDHFLLTRPIDVSANSAYLFYYPYGSGGQEGWQIHRGLDMPNLVGQEVLATGSGKVIWACSSDCDYSEDEVGDLEVYDSYGKFVVIEHDFSWRGDPLWTLYAHLSAITVQKGQTIRRGDIIGLVGTTGRVTGPHVHFEVRLGRNSYSSTRNPILWMAPYLNHGVVAGQILDGSGRMIDNALVELYSEGGRRVDYTRTYDNPCQRGRSGYCTVVPDDFWQENFVMGDIAEGRYRVDITVNGQKYSTNVTVRAGRIEFVEMQLDVAATPQVVTTHLAPSATPTGLPPTALPSPTPRP